MESYISQPIDNMEFDDIIEKSVIVKPVKKTINKPPELHYLNPKQVAILLTAVKSPKHKTAILLMVDCGLRVSECVNLKLSNFNFKNQTLTVKSLKKRDETDFRTIPIGTRLLSILADYIVELNAKTNNQFLFPSPADHSKPITRKAINQLLNRVSINQPSLKNNLHPHALRHTFATQLLATGTPLHNVSGLLGHKNYSTTLIYNHTPIELLRQNIEMATTKPVSFITKLVYKIFGIKQKQVNIITLSSDPENFTVGRSIELNQLISNIAKGLNTILIGKIGVGKSHILNQLDFKNQKILKIDEMANLKQTFVNMLLFILNNDKEHIKDLLFGDYDTTQLKAKLQRSTVYNIIQEITKLTAKKEYILLIDNVDGITVKGMKVIESLKDHFTIVTSARTISISKANFIWNFDIIEVKPFNRDESLQLIHRLSYDISTDNPELFRNHIIEQSEGNPRIIFEMVNRFRKEIFVTTNSIRNIRHIGALPEIDVSFIVLFVAAGIALLRYTNKEIGGISFRFIGGLALVFLMLARFFFAKTKRRFL
jgi:integrase/recombinase XerD